MLEGGVVMNEVQRNFKKEMGLDQDLPKKNNKLTNCKACGKELAKSVKKCPNCGKDQRSFFGRHKILTGFVVVILALLAIGKIGTTILPPPNQDAPGSQKNAIEASIEAEGFVKEVLKAPSTAKFPGAFDQKPIVTYRVDKANNVVEYEVSSYVDAQNSFGAMIRNNYHVYLAKNNNGWYLLRPVQLDN